MASNILPREPTTLKIALVDLARIAVTYYMVQLGSIRESERTPMRASSAGAGRSTGQRSAQIVGSSTDGTKHMEGVL